MCQPKDCTKCTLWPNPFYGVLYERVRVGTLKERDELREEVQRLRTMERAAQAHAANCRENGGLFNVAAEILAGRGPGEK